MRTANEQQVLSEADEEIHDNRMKPASAEPLAGLPLADEGDPRQQGLKRRSGKASGCRNH